MSKSLDNYVGIADAPDEMFGKLMSISDELMWRYFELLSFRSMEEINSFRQQTEEGANPRDMKFLLAEELIARFHDSASAAHARENFIARFQKGAMPDEMPEITLEPGSEGIPIANLLKEAGLVSSTNEAFRMIKQGAVRIDGERVEEKERRIETGTTAIFQVGKRRFARVTVV
jgi:tyrosyl-tRNA synthetase